MSETVVIFAINPSLGISGFLPNATLSASYSATLTAFGGQAPFRFTKLSGVLQTGLTFTDNGDGTCVVSGTPTAASEVTIRVRLRDGTRKEVEKDFSIRVIAAPLTLSLTLPDATANQAYSGTASASGGVAPYTYAKVAGPAWLTVSAAGAIGGTPTDSDETASVSVSVRATDDDGSEVEATDSLAVIVLTPVTITGTFPNALTGTAYDETLPITGGTGTYDSAVVQTGSIASWMTLEISGTNLRLHGTPDDVGATWEFTARVTDSGANTGDTSAQSVENTGDEWTPADWSGDVIWLNADTSAASLVQGNAPSGKFAIWNDSGTTGAGFLQEGVSPSGLAVATRNGLRFAEFTATTDRVGGDNTIRAFLNSAPGAALYAVLANSIADTVDTIRPEFHFSAESGSGQTPKFTLWQGARGSVVTAVGQNTPSAMARLVAGGTSMAGSSATEMGADVPYVHSAIADAAGAGDIYNYINGTLDHSDLDTAAITPGNFTSSPCQNVSLGSNTGSNRLRAYVYQFIAIKVTPTSAEHQRFEGYLAYAAQGDGGDLDFVGALDASHTYKLGRPIKAPA